MNTREKAQGKDGEEQQSLVDWLRWAGAQQHEFFKNRGLHFAVGDYRLIEAADEIERLHRQIAELEASRDKWRKDCHDMKHAYDLCNADRKQRGERMKAMHQAMPDRLWAKFKKWFDENGEPL